jgi:hypothetical protein
MAEGYVDENGLIRWGEQHDFEELAVPPGRADEDHGEEDEDGDDEDGDDEPEGDDD